MQGNVSRTEDLIVRITKHSKEKMKVRGIKESILEEILSNPEHKFYDTFRDTEVFAKSVMFENEFLTFVLIISKRGYICSIITIYPSRNF